MTNEQLKAWRARLSLGEAGMAAYLGVPVTTYRKWENGTRSQDASTRRLFEVLQAVECDMASPGGLHDRLIGAATTMTAPAEKPKRKAPGVRKLRGVTTVHCRDLLPSAPDVPDWMKTNG